MLKRFFDHKRWVILSAAISVLMLVVLASGLGSLHFLPGRPLAQGDSVVIQVSVEKIAAQIADIPFWKQIAFLVLVFLLVLIVISILPAEWRKRILKYFLRAAVFVLAIFYFLKRFGGLLPQLDLSKAGAAQNAAPAAQDAAQVVFTPPSLPPGLLYLVSLLVLLGVLAASFLVGRWWKRRLRLPVDSAPLDGLAEAARFSLAEISAGRDWQDAIIQCYTRMNEIVGAKRALQRRKDWSPGEFAVRLEAGGLPPGAIRRLTRLFEAARYGDGHSSPEDVAEATSCLAEILHACGVTL